MNGIHRGMVIGLGTLHRTVYCSTLVFLVLPLLLFAAGWLRLPYSLLFSALLICAAALSCTDRSTLRQQRNANDIALPIWKVAIALLPVTLMVMTSGAGGFGPRNWDWVKHDAILMDLVQQPWPVRYRAGTDLTGLTYYVAYYLPAAALGKLGGWTLANIALLTTSIIGILLTYFWLLVLSQGAIFTSGIVLTLFSGMDVPGALLDVHSVPDLARIFSDYHLEWWAHRWQFSSNVSLISFVPQQVLAGWLLTALILDAMAREDTELPVMFLFALSLPWSPFVAIGLAPLLCAAYLTKCRGIRSAITSQIGIRNAAGLFVIALMATYYASRLVEFKLPPAYAATSASPERGGFWFFPAHEWSWSLLAQYSLFVTCEFLVLWLLLLYARSPLLTGWRGNLLLITAGLTLLLLPWFHYGWYNDLVMRASIPALFVLQVESIRVLHCNQKRSTLVALVAVLSCGALYSANLLRMHVQWVLTSGRLAHQKSERSVHNLFEIQLRDPSARTSDFIRQYLGATDSLFFSQLAKPSRARGVVRNPAGMQ